MEFNSKFFSVHSGWPSFWKPFLIHSFPNECGRFCKPLVREGASGLRRMGLFSLAAGLIVLWLTLG